MKAMKVALAAVAVLVVVAALLLVVGIPSGFVTTAIQKRIERETGYRVVVSGATRFGLAPLSLTAHDISLRNPTDTETAVQATLDSVRLDLGLSDVFSRHPKVRVTTLEVVHPVVRVPLLRERVRNANRATKSPAKSDAFTVDRVIVRNGAAIFANAKDRVETRVEGISADVDMRGERKIDISGDATAGGHAVKFDIKASPPAPLSEKQNIPFELALDAPGVLRSRLSARAQMRVSGSIVTINNVTGTIGDDEFNGWAAADVSSKPLLKLDLDFQRLDIDTGETHAATQAQPWSNVPIDLSGLNYVDTEMRLSIANLHYGVAQLSATEIDATIASGVLTVASRFGAYEGEAEGELIVDASTSDPSYALRGDLRDVKALPLLKSLAQFEKLAGKMQAKIAVQAKGASQRALVSNLSGTVFTNFEDGAIQGLNVAKMIRALTTSPLSGWQENGDQSTDMAQLSASFRLDKGQASSSDLALAGPLVRMTGAGTIDLVSKSLAFRVEPKLVMSIQGQGSAANPVGLGVPVIIEGPWSEPRIYPEMSGILDNTEDAYAKLKEMGKGLFGPNGGAPDPLGIGGALGSLGGSGAGGAAGGGSLGNALGGSVGGSLGGSLGSIQEKLAPLIQGLGRDRTAAPDSPPLPPATAAPAGPDPALATQPQPSDSGAMNSILKDLFSR